MDEREGLPLSGHCPAVPQPTQLGGELTILVDGALSADRSFIDRQHIAALGPVAEVVPAGEWSMSVSRYRPAH